jgi:hypothetical protein
MAAHAHQMPNAIMESAGMEGAGAMASGVEISVFHLVIVMVMVILMIKHRETVIVIGGTMAVAASMNLTLLL